MLDISKVVLNLSFIEQEETLSNVDSVGDIS